MNWLENEVEQALILHAVIPHGRQWKCHQKWSQHLLGPKLKV